MNARQNERWDLGVAIVAVLIFVLLLPVSKQPFDWPARLVCMLMGAAAISTWTKK